MKHARYYYVEGPARWFVCVAGNKAKARTEGVIEFGRNGVVLVRRATQKDVRAYEEQKGAIASVKVLTAGKNSQTCCRK